MKPVLLITGHAPSYRVGAFAHLHEREGIEVALFGGRSRHGGSAHRGELPFPHRHVEPRELAALAASGEHRAVVCSTAGRLALLASWRGARRAGLPLILWASLWAHPRTAAHSLSYLPLRRLYRSAEAVVTYGPHVSAYVRARGASNVHIAPQSVDNDFWGAPAIAPPSSAAFSEAAAVKTRFLFVGRPDREKGARVLLEAWRASGLRPPAAALCLVGVGSNPRGSAASAAEQERDGILSLDPVAPEELRSIYAACQVLVIPSIATRTFREPWGLVANEAMNRGLAVIASDAVGAAAGGLVRDRETGLVVRAGDSAALASAIGRLARNAPLCAQLGRRGAQEVRSLTHAAWAEGFSEALATLGLDRERLVACVDQV